MIPPLINGRGALGLAAALTDDADRMEHAARRTGGGMLEIFQTERDAAAMLELQARLVATTPEERDLLDWLLMPDAVVYPEFKTDPLSVIWHAYRRNDRSFSSTIRIEAIRAAVAYNKAHPS